MSTEKVKKLKEKIQKIIDEKLYDLFSEINDLGYIAELHIKIEGDHYENNSFEIWRIEEI